MNITELKELAESIISTITQLEDAQGEIRALRATEAGLRERVKELEEGLADAAQSLCWLAFGECRNITDRPLLTALQVESSARALLEKKE